MAIFLGIDGGGTRTSCLIGDEDSILGSGTAGASNVLRVGQAEASRSVIDAIRQACDRAGVDPTRIVRTCVGVAGAARPEVAEIVRKTVSETVSGEIQVVGDMVIALHAAFGIGPGIIVIAGTGSVAYGRDPNGLVARAGGWGFAVSDEGSGHWIGRTAVAGALREADRSPALRTSLLQTIMKSWNIENCDELVVAANASPPPNFAELFPAVLAAADSSDELAADVLRRAGIELAALAKIVVGRLFGDARTVPVAMSGGVFRTSVLVRETFYHELRNECAHAQVVEKITEPVRGALELARNSRHERQIPYR